MSDRKMYDASTFDRSRVNAYALRVVNETSRPLSDALTYVKATPKETRSRGLFGLGVKTTMVSVDEIIEALGQHWPLDQRHHTIQRTDKLQDGGERVETSREKYVLALLPDGELIRICMLEEVNAGFARRDGLSWKLVEVKHRSWPASDQDLLNLDFEKRYCERGGRSRVTSWGDLEGGKLIRHAKGVGVNLALKSLM